MRLRTAILSTALLLAAPLLSAQTTTYYYTGTDFTYIQGNQFTTMDYVSGSFTLPTLLVSHDTIITQPTAVTFDFSDGVAPDVTNSNANSYSFNLTTDGSGNIVDAVISISLGIDDGIYINYPGTPGDYDMGGTNIASYGKSGANGMFSLTNPSATPEPSSFVLMLTALLGFGLAVRKQLVPRLLPASRIAR